MKNANSNKPSIVLVHGAFADGTGWQKIIPILEKDGFTVTAVQNPLRSLAEDIATTKRVIDFQLRPVTSLPVSPGRNSENHRRSCCRVGQIAATNPSNIDKQTNKQTNINN